MTLTLVPRLSLLKRGRAWEVITWGTSRVGHDLIMWGWTKLGILLFR